MPPYRKSALLEWDSANILLLSPGGHIGLVHNTQTPGTLSCNGNFLSPNYEIIDRNLGKSPSLWAAKSTYKALTHCMPVAQCLNKLCWQPATTAGRGVTFLSSEQQAVNFESQWQINVSFVSNLMKLPEEGRSHSKVSSWKTEFTVMSMGIFFSCIFPDRKNNIEFCISSQIFSSHKCPHQKKLSVNCLSTQVKVCRHLHFSHWEAVAEFWSSAG